MGISDTLLDQLCKSPPAESLELAVLMIKRLENILNEPNNPIHRTFTKSDPAIENISHLPMALYCFRVLKCIEQPEYIFVPQNCDLTLVRNIKDTFIVWKESMGEDHTSQEEHSLVRPKRIRPIVLPPLYRRYTHPFFSKIEVMFHSCLRYADKGILERARKLLPINMLECRAQQRLRDFQRQIKLKQATSLDISLQDMLILELLEWFKESFFTWVDSPPCDYCRGKTQFSHMSTDKTHFQYANRIESHKCNSCSRITVFPRYEDLNILLETRRGRCGEWANVFTLFCRSMGWDTRIVFDETDHVWTEVFSIAQKRWLHCDSCENICDQPLIYESGWKKPISYVIAYSNEEVQDVTWRYTSNFKETLERRKMCEESALVDVLSDLRKRRQEKLSAARRKYLTRRIAMEVAEFLTEKKPGEGDGIGRQSGNLSWRLTRGEIHDSFSSNFAWRIDPAKLPFPRATVFYSASKDAYHLISEGLLIETRNGWATGCCSYENMFRKEEKDWKQAYLARKANAPEGTITWNFEFPESSTKILGNTAVRFSCVTYANATIRAQIGCDDLVQDLPIDSTVFKTNKFAGKTKVWVKATLRGGKGDIAWQHAQLFRQPLDSENFPFAVAFTFI